MAKKRHALVAKIDLAGADVDEAPSTIKIKYALEDDGDPTLREHGSITHVLTQGQRSSLGAIIGTIVGKVTDAAPGLRRRRVKAVLRLGGKVRKSTLEADPTAEPPGGANVDAPPDHLSISYEVADATDPALIKKAVVTHKLNAGQKSSLNAIIGNIVQKVADETGVPV